MTDARRRSILVCGGGFAGQMVTGALAHHLADTVEITWLDCVNTTSTDTFYGSVTGPNAYTFNLSMNVTEPELLLNSDTAFSLGTKFDNWSNAGLTWHQCFHLPLPVIGAVPFHHHLTRRNRSRLDPYLISAASAQRGAFAHPPDDRKIPLSRAEYSYQISPSKYGSIFEARAARAGIKKITAKIAEITKEDNRITAIKLNDNSTLTADLIIDCTGPDANLLASLSPRFVKAHDLFCLSSTQYEDKLGSPHRTLISATYGWQADTPLQAKTHRLTVCAPESQNDALTGHGREPTHSFDITTGRFDTAWVGNCVAIGHSAGILEPLTPAPIILLQRDIERLLDLIPLSDDHNVEQREFNRRFAEDYEHANLFHRALFEVSTKPNGPYWYQSTNQSVPAKLKRKINQFKSRGILVGYDLEPFNEQDWTILHYGMDRQPKRYDRVADQIPVSDADETLENIRMGIKKMVDKMPSHDTYMSSLLRYLKQNKG